MSPSPEAVATAVVLFAAMAAYAVFAGADFGGGIWDLLAGGAERGAEPRAAVDASVTPVWEGNQVWIVYGFVIVWTGFPAAFAAVMTALFAPLCLSLLGLFFRGIGFSFRHEAERPAMKRLSGALFAASSLVTPFFLGTVIGAVADGGVPVRPTGNVLAAWTSPVALVTGFLFVAACAYIGAVYLVGDCDRRGEPDMVRYFSRRAVVSGLVTGVIAAVNLALMRTSTPYVFHRLFGPALPLVVLSVAAGAAALVLVLARRTVLLRVTAALAVVSVIGAWGWAQYPWLLPGVLDLRTGSAPRAALLAELVVAALAVLLVVPSFSYLYWLQQHSRLQESPPSEGLRQAVEAQQRAETPAPAAPRPAGRGERFAAGAVLAAAAVRLAVETLTRRRARAGGPRARRTSAPPRTRPPGNGE
ncbi:cytochrome d ubiquinol oxidase subunit II [Streptomyces naganishii]|uniref:cytochrome d ubiquinol oxidase subunit II n=1 Tax=Streptomyces naganishii TaxID=285447 RepID=UPI00167E3985|nr:cytochrome d ubiquinol oxidase subunit II [Streptomyces naganishii]